MRYAAMLHRLGSRDFETDAGYHRGPVLEDHKTVLVPEGQSLDFDEGTIMRRWLHPYLEGGWHLAGFLEVVK